MDETAAGFLCFSAERLHLIHSQEPSELHIVDMIRDVSASLTASRDLVLPRQDFGDLPIADTVGVLKVNVLVLWIDVSVISMVHIFTGGVLEAVDSQQLITQMRLEMAKIMQ